MGVQLLLSPKKSRASWTPNIIRLWGQICSWAQNIFLAKVHLFSDCIWLMIFRFYDSLSFLGKCNSPANVYREPLKTLPRFCEVGWSSCVCLPTAGRKTQLFHPMFTQPGKSFLEVPCILWLWSLLPVSHLKSFPYLNNHNWVPPNFQDESRRHRHHGLGCPPTLLRGRVQPKGPLGWVG